MFGGYQHSPNLIQNYRAWSLCAVNSLMILMHRKQSIKIIIYTVLLCIKSVDFLWIKEGVTFEMTRVTILAGKALCIDDAS